MTSHFIPSISCHGMCRKKQVNPTCRASPPTWKTAGFKPLETIPSVLPWLAALNKKGRGSSEFTRLTADAEWLACVYEVNKALRPGCNQSFSQPPSLSLGR